MAASLQVITNQIKALEAKAEKIRASGVNVLKRIRKDVQRFGFTPADVFGATAKGHATPTAQGTAKLTKPKNPTAGKKVPPKYRDGDLVWSGRGSMPMWLRAALKGGRELDSFLVDKAQAAAAPKAAKTPAAAKPAKVSKPQKAVVKVAAVAAVKKPVADAKAKVAAPAPKVAAATKKPAQVVKAATVASAPKPVAAAKQPVVKGGKPAAKTPAAKAPAKAPAAAKQAPQKPVDKKPAAKPAPVKKAPQSAVKAAGPAPSPVEKAAGTDKPTAP